MATNRLSILLVEDNPGDVRLVKEMLSEAPDERFVVSHVENFNAAVERLSAEIFDVLLLDLLLDDKSRLNTLLQIHEQAARMPTVVLTGMDDRTVESWVFHEGAHDYLVKDGMDARMLIDSIECAIAEHNRRVSQSSSSTSGMSTARPPMRTIADVSAG